MNGGKLDSLHGGGAAGDVLRAIDWSRNPLGSIAQWPLSLQAVVRAMGFQEHAAKPIEPDLLVSTVAALAGR